MTAEAEPTPAPVAAAPRAAAHGLTVPAYSIMLAVLVGGTALHVALHHQAHGVVNLHHVVIAFFLVLNVMINFWEIGLLVQSRAITAEYEASRERFRGREMARINEVFAQPIPLFGILSTKNWTGIWSGYALFDPGYADRRSFGFNIDVGNGLSTIVPSTLFAFGMTYELMSPVWLGILGVAVFWQMFYGTVLYFFQFFLNRRHVGHSLTNLLLFVVGTNGLWFVLSPWGLWVSIELILSGSFAVLR